MTPVRIIVLAMLGVVIAAVAAVAVLLMIPSGRLTIAEKAIAAAGVHAVKIGSTEGTWPGHIILRDVDVSDRDGAWLHVDRFDLTWHPFALLHGRINVDALDVGTATIARWPTSPPGKTSEPPTIDDVRRSLANLTVQRLNIRALIIHNEGRVTTVAITGAALPQADGRVVTLDVTRKDQPGSAALRLSMTRTKTVADVRGSVANISGNGSLSSDVGSDTIAGIFHVACAGDTGCYTWSGGKVGAVEADLTVNGSLSHPAYAADVRVKTARLDARPIEELTAKVTLDQGEKGAKRITAEGTLANMAETFREVAPVVDKQGKWMANALWDDGGVVIEQARIDSGGLALQASGKFHDGAFSEVNAVANIRGTGRLAGVKEDRSLTTAALFLDRVEGDKASGRMDVTVTEVGKDLALPPVATGDLHLSARITMDGKQLMAKEIAGTWGALVVKGETAWATEKGFDHAKSVLDVTVATKDVPALPQPFTAKVTATGPINAVKVNVDGSTPELRLTQAKPLTAVVLKLDAARVGATWSGALKSTAQSDDMPLTLDATFAKSANELSVDDLRLAGKGPLAAGSAKVDVKTHLATGAFESKDAQLAGLAKIFGIEVAVPGHVRVELAARNGKQDVVASVDATQVVADGVVADQLNAEGTLSDAYGEGQVKASVNLRDGNLFGRPVTSFAVKAVGRFANMAVDVNAKGTPAKPFTMVMATHVSAKAATAITFNRLMVENPRLKGELAAPARLTISDAEVALAPFKATVGGGTVTGELRINRAKGTVTGNLKSADVAWKVNEAEIGTHAAVLFTGETTVSGPAANAALDGRLTAKYTATDHPQPVESHFTLKLKNGRAALTGTAMGLSGRDMQLAAEFPAHLDMMAGRFTMDQNAPMTASVQWAGDVTTLWQLVALDQHTLSGQADVDVHVRGTLGDPRITGRVHVTDGRYENFVSLTTLRGLDLDLTASDGNAFSVTLTASDGNSGTISAKGKMSPAAKEWAVAVDSELNKFHLLRRDDVSGAATGKVTYAGSLTTGAITGRLTLERAEMVLGASYIPDVPLLRGRPGELLKNKKPAGFSSVRLDVALNVGDVMRVTGKGLESFWRGSLHAGGTIATVDLTGSLTLARGTFSFVGQQFQLDEGTVTFTGGGTAINPDLNITASKQTADITANLIIGGNARAPRITLASTPALPRDEVLARLLFRKDSTELGPVESVQLASAAAELTGLQSGGINGLLRKPLGLDTISVGGRTGKSLVLGRQITNSLYIGAEQSLTGSDREIVIERRLTPTLSLQSSTSDQTGADIGIVWRKNY